MARRPRTSHGPEGPPDVSVVTTGHDVADARLHREVAALRRLGLQVEVLGLGDAADGPAGAQVLTRARSGLAGRALAALTVPWRARGRVLVTLDPDARAGAVPAARLRRRRLVADVHEDYAALLADRAWATGAAGRVGAQVAALATRLAGRADLTVVAAAHVPPRQARNRLVLRNLPDLSM
ncbi:MAG: glycosyltransferase, partial [Motilibacteraceae bacterium]